MRHRMPRSPFCNMEHKEEDEMQKELEELKELAKTFRKAADIVDKMAGIAENEQLTREEQEEQMETATAEFVVQMMKLQKLNGAM